MAHAYPGTCGRICSKALLETPDIYFDYTSLYYELAFEPITVIMKFAILIGLHMVLGTFSNL